MLRFLGFRSSSLWPRHALAAAVLSLAVASLALASSPSVPTAAGAAPTQLGKLYALLTASFDHEFAPPQSAIEIVNLTSMSTTATLSLGARAVSSLAVSANGSRLYVADQTNNAVAVFDPTGALVASVPVQGPRDLVLSPGGATLYVAAARSIVAIDTATNTTQTNLATVVRNPDGAIIQEDVTTGIAVSPDGSTLATVGYCQSGCNDGIEDGPRLYLVNAPALTVRTRLALTNPMEPTNCALAPADAAFVDNALLLLWDSNCDNLYQVDVATLVQLTARTIRMGRDQASFFNFNNMLFYSASSARAYALKESNELAVMDPATVTGTLLGMFSGIPFVPALTPDGGTLFISVIHRFSGGGADTLDQFDTGMASFTRGVYTFTLANMSVRDMRVVPPPGQAVPPGCAQRPPSAPAVKPCTP